MNRLLIIAAFFALVFCDGQSALAKSGYDLFQKGLVKERVEGDLDEAIRLYKQIVEDYTDGRALAAKALVQMGGCYEKLGRAEARKAYERVLHEYADQPEAVSTARLRLSTLDQAESSAKPSGMVVRRVATGMNYGALSHDGKYLTYTDWDTGDVAVRELATGQGRRVTNKGSWKESKACGWGPVFSPDDKQLAYTWLTEAEQLQVRTINVDGSGLHILASKKWLELADWSPDGKHLLGFQIESKGGPYNLGLFSITDGSMRVFKTYQSRSWGTIRFSPDGRYIAYDLRQKDDPAQRDIFLISVDDGREIPLIEHPADDSLLGWAPDGKRLVFASDRTGLMGVWVINLVDGQREGVPKLLKTQMGKFTPLGMDRDGSYYFGLDSGAKQSFYTATLDPETGKVLKPPVEVVKPSDGTINMPEWSPDGKQLAYLVCDKDRDRRRLVIHSLATGASREIVPKPQFKSFNIGSLRWSPDGRFLLGWGQLEKEWAVLQIDVHSGEVSSIKEGGFWGPKWSPNGKAIYFAGPARRHQRPDVLPKRSGNRQGDRDVRTAAGLLLLDALPGRQANRVRRFRGGCHQSDTCHRRRAARGGQGERRRLYGLVARRALPASTSERASCGTWP